jgi:hypothetical protein
MKPPKIAIEPAQTYWTDAGGGRLVCMLSVPPGSRVFGIYENNLLVERGVFLLNVEPVALRFMAMPVGVELEGDDPEGQYERGPLVGVMLLGKNLLPYCIFSVLERATKAC